jgi:hypothetical protein
MRKTHKALLAGAALAAIAVPAYAQLPFGLDAIFGTQANAGPDQAILYEYPNFQGRAVLVTREQGNLSNVGFNDRARSIRVTGSWRLCEDAGYRSRCETISGPIADLRQVGIQGLSSLQMVAGYGTYPGASYPGYPTYPGAGYGQGVPGQSVVFYPGPIPTGYYGGSSNSARRQADDFCRSMGHRSAAYYDSNSGYNRVVSDVLCRR